MIGLRHLPNRQRDEEVLFLLRRDVFILLYLVLRYVVYCFVPVVARIFVINFFPHLLVDDASRVVLLLIMIGYYMYIWLFFYRGFLDYYLDTWIVTNHRILNIEQEGLFRRTVAEVKLFTIQDVTTEQHGLLATFINYGDIYVQTAGTRPRVVFEQVSDPNKVARQITQLVRWNKKAFPHDH